VHNGIIENYLELGVMLREKGVHFRSETDTETVAHLIRHYYNDDLVAAVSRALQDVRGAYALGVISKDHPGLLVAARNGSPLVIGVGEGEGYIASDAPALLQHTRRFMYLEDGQVATITEDRIDVRDLQGEPQSIEIQTVDWDQTMAEKGGYPHFMLKEIHEQPWAVRETTIGRTSAETGRVYLHEMGLDEAALKKIDRVLILACGTSWHAGLVGKFVIEELARVPVEVDYSSEFRYRRPIVDGRTLTIVITQSGETADTLGALREAKRLGARSIAICNVVGSMATREAEGTVSRLAPPEE
jgi:glucosamine--fructose-6-phosphate aminotransferase (isomerizing)